MSDVQTIIVRTGVSGIPGVVAATAPATYDPSTHTVGVTVGTTSGTVAAGDAPAAAQAAAIAAAASDATSKVAAEATARSSGDTAAIASAASSAAGLYVPLTAPGSTIAQLVGGKVPSSQIPSLALVTVVPAANQAAMLALTTTQVQPGDVAVRSDGAGSFMLAGTGDPSVLGNWILLAAPTDAVTSVNTHSGAVVLTSADVGAAFADNGDGTVTLTL